MKIKDIYKTNSFCFVSVITAVLCAGITLLTALVPEIYTSLTYAYPIRYPWQVLSGIFVHGSPNMTVTETIGHLGFNLLLVLPFGIMIEKIIGSKKFAALFGCLWLANAATFYIMAIISTPFGENTYGAGISGIAFSYGIIGLYALYKLFMQDKKTAVKQVSFWFLLNIAVIMLILINPFVAGVSSMILHMSAVAAGIVFLLIFHEDIDSFVTA